MEIPTAETLLQKAKNLADDLFWGSPEVKATVVAKIFRAMVELEKVRVEAYKAERGTGSRSLKSASVTEPNRIPLRDMPTGPDGT